MLSCVKMITISRLSIQCDCFSKQCISSNKIGSFKCYIPYCDIARLYLCSRNYIVNSLLPFIANNIWYLIIFICSICSSVYLEDSLESSVKNSVSPSQKGLKENKPLFTLWPCFDQILPLDVCRRGVHLLNSNICHYLSILGVSPSDIASVQISIS